MGERHLHHRGIYITDCGDNKADSKHTYILPILRSLLDVVLELGIGVWVVVHQVHLVTLHHHTGISSTNAASTDDAHLQQQQQQSPPPR